MKVLGISEIDNDAGAVLFLDGELHAAAGEERFSRRKMHKGFPYRAVEWLLRSGKVRAKDLDLVAIVKPEPRAELDLIDQALLGHDFFAGPGPWRRQALNWLVFRGYRRVASRLELARLGRQVSAWLEAASVHPSRVVRAHHHRSHAASAFFASGFDRALAVTCDGQGGGVTASAYRCAGATMDVVHEVKTPDSMGFFYAMVTRALGFRPSRHEGKVTGLAAFAPADARALALFRAIAHTAGEAFTTPGVYGALGEVKKLAREIGREGVAAAAQQVLEEVIVAYVSGLLARTGERSLALAGGVFANVRLNQKLHQAHGVERIFVFPHMGDGGLGYGAAVDLLAELVGRKSRAIEDVYWGPAYEDGDLEAALLRAGLDYVHAPDIEARVSRLLAQGKVVGRLTGRMEFGPRALGNRSILCAATDRGINDRLNRQLQRTEFMPFAPVVRAEDAPRLFHGYAGAEHTAEFMTITFDCGAEMKEAAPAVVHVDGTARPQVLRSAVNPSYHEILDGYRRLTGRPALVNTSFNVHEEPIVMTPDDAIRAYQGSGLDALALGPFLCERRS